MSRNLFRFLFCRANVLYDFETLNQTTHRTCALFLIWKIKFQQAEPTVALSASSVIQGQGLEVKGRLCIEPSAGGGGRWACRRPIEAARAVDGAAARWHTRWRRFHCVDAKLRRQQ